MATQLLEKSAVQDVSGRGLDDTRPLGVKSCPQCGQILFEDMQVCYGCLYRFDEEDVHNGYLECMPVSDDLLDEVEPYFATEQRTIMVNAPEDEGGLDCDTMRLGLYVQTGDVNLLVPLPKQGLTVGRMPTNDVVLHSRAVSKRHVVMTPKGNVARIDDLGATNPAILEGHEVTGGEEMRLGDTLDVCGSLLTLVRWTDEEI